MSRATASAGPWRCCLHCRSPAASRRARSPSGCGPSTPSASRWPCTPAAALADAVANSDVQPHHRARHHSRASTGGLGTVRAFRARISLRGRRVAPRGHSRHAAGQPPRDSRALSALFCAREGPGLPPLFDRRPRPHHYIAALRPTGHDHGVRRLTDQPDSTPGQCRIQRRRSARCCQSGSSRIDAHRRRDQLVDPRLDAPWRSTRPPPRAATRSPSSRR